MAGGKASAREHPQVRCGLRIALAAASVVLISASASAADAVSSRLIPGYYDIQSHTFRPVPRTAPASPKAPKLVSGTIVIQFTAQLEASIPQDAILEADGSLAVSDTTFSYSIAAVTTAKRSGHTAKATIRMPYKLAVASPADSLTIRSLITARADPTHFQDMTRTIPLPADGATTTITFDAHL
jgi:hypothetical protein